MARTLPLHPSEPQKDKMKQGSIGWSEKRRISSLTLAYYVESQGLEWTSIREAAPKIAAELGITTAKKRRSVLAVECHERLVAQGVIYPENYVPPWQRISRSARPAFLRT